MKTPEQWVNEHSGSSLYPSLGSFVKAIQKEAYDEGWRKGMMDAILCVRAAGGQSVNQLRWAERAILNAIDARKE